MTLLPQKALMLMLAVDIDKFLADSGDGLEAYGGVVDICAALALAYNPSQYDAVAAINADVPEHGYIRRVETCLDAGFTAPCPNEIL